MRSSVTSRRTSAEPVRSQLEEFRYCLEIPVAVTDIDMPKVCSELRQFLPHVKTCTIPFHKPTRCEAVSKILKPRPAADAAIYRGCAQTNSTGNLGESAPCGIAWQPPAVFRNQKRFSPSFRTERIATLYILHK